MNDGFRILVLILESGGQALLKLVYSPVKAGLMSLQFFCPFPHCLRMTITASVLKLDTERSRERRVQPGPSAAAEF